MGVFLFSILFVSARLINRIAVHLSKSFLYSTRISEKRCKKLVLIICMLILFQGKLKSVFIYSLFRVKTDSDLGLTFSLFRV